MSTKNYASKVQDWLAAEQDERIRIMRELLREQGENGDERFGANTVYNMSTSQLREAVNEFIDAGPLAEKIEEIIEAMSGDTEAIMEEVEGLSPVETWEYLREVDAKATIAQLKGADTMSPLPLEDVLRQTEAEATYRFREGHFEKIPGLADLPEAKIREILEAAAEGSHTSDENPRDGDEQFDYEAAITKAKEDPIQKAVDDAGITKAADGVRVALDDLAKTADEAGKQAVEAGATAVKDATNTLDGAAAAAAKAAQDAIDAAAKAAQDAVDELDTAVREGLDEGGKLAERLREDLDKAIDDVTKGVEGATGRLGKTGDDLLNGLAEGVGDFLADTAWIGSYQFTFGFDLKADKTPPTLGTTEPPPGDTDKMTPGQTPDGTHDTRSAGDRLRNARGDRISERTDNGPGTGSSGSSNSSTSSGGGTPGGDSGAGGLGGGDAMPTRLPSTGGTDAGGADAEAPGAGEGAGQGAGTDTDQNTDDDGFSFTSVKIDDQWYELDSEGNPVGDAAAAEAATAATGAEAAAGAEGDAATDMEYSSDRDTAGPTGVDTGTGRMVDAMVQQYRDITDAARAGSEVNPVREGVEFGHMTLDDLPTARGLQQPPPGEDFIDAELVDQRGPDYSSSTGAGVINDPNMTSGPDGPTDDPADVNLDRPEDLSHLADGITGGTATDAVSTGPLPSGVSPADLRIGDPVVGRATAAPPIEAPSFGSGASGEQYTAAPVDPNFGAGAGDNQDGADESEPEADAATEPPPFEPAPMYAIGGPVSGSSSISEPSESTSDSSIGRSSEYVPRGVEALGDPDRIERNASETTVDLIDGG